VRLFAGSGMRRDVWQRLRERFGVGVMEFYASTERNLVLANASGEKMGALGRLLPGSAELAIARYDFAAGDFVKRGDRLRRCHADEAGVALVRVREHVGGPGVMADVFERGDRWLRSGDVLRRDRDGDHWFVDRLANMWCVAGVPVATPRIEDALYGLTEVTLAVAYAHDGELVADVMSREPLEASRFSARLALWLGPHERPRVIRRVAAIGLTEGFNTMKAPMRSAGVEVLQTLTYDEAAQRYA
jgi:putative long chain acyl-CoA synthase